MNYDVYEVEIDTGIKGYRLLQHVKATDASDAQLKVLACHEGSQANGVTFRRPCKPEEIAKAIADGIVPVGTVATAIEDVPAELLPADEVKP